MLALHDHFLVTNNVNHIQKQDGQKLLSISYQGKRKNWTLERIITAHKVQHTILEGLTDHRYCGLDARTKVTRLLYRIKTDSLDAVKEKIMQDSKLLRYFERCVSFYKELIKQPSGSQSNESRRVAEFGLHKKGNVDAEDWYYSKEEYKKIPTNSKEKLWKLHEGRPQDGRP